MIVSVQAIMLLYNCLVQLLYDFSLIMSLSYMSLSSQQHIIQDGGNHDLAIKCGLFEEWRKGKQCYLCSFLFLL